VIVSGEVDLGMKRTDYQNTAELARWQNGDAFGVAVRRTQSHLVGKKLPAPPEKKNSPSVKVDPSRYKRLAASPS